MKRKILVKADQSMTPYRFIEPPLQLPQWPSFHQDISQRPGRSEGSRGAGFMAINYQHRLPDALKKT